MKGFIIGIIIGVLAIYFKAPARIHAVVMILNYQTDIWLILSDEHRCREAHCSDKEWDVLRKSFRHAQHEKARYKKILITGK